MYRYKSNVTIAAWIAQIAVMLAGGALLFAFLAAFGGR